MQDNEASGLAKLIDAINNGNVVQVKRLLQQGVVPRGGLDSANITPLHFAAQQGSVGVVKILLAAGADVTETTQPDGETAYDIARIYGHLDVMALLKVP